MATLPPITEEELAEVRATNTPDSLESPALKSRERAIVMSTRDAQMWEDMAKTPEGRAQLKKNEEYKQYLRKQEAKREAERASKPMAKSNAPVPVKVSSSAFTKQAGPKENDNDFIVKSGIMEAYLSGSSMPEAIAKTYQESQKNFPQDVAANKTSQIVAEDRQQYREMAQDILVNSDTQEEAITGLAAVQDLEEESYGQQDIDFTALGLTLSPDIGDEVIKKLAVKAKVARQQAEIFDNMDWMDWGRNILGIVLPGKQLKDNYDLTESVFSGEEWAQNFIDNWQALSPEEQEERLPAVKEMFMDVLPEMRAAQMLGALTKANPEEAMEELNALWAAWDVAEISTLGLKAFSTIRKFNKGQRLIKVMAENGKKEEAGEIVATALSTGSEEALDVVGTDVLGAAGSASKLNTEALVTTSVDGLSKPIMNSLDEFAGENKKLLDEVKEGKLYIKERFLTTAERERVDEAIVGRLQSRTDVDNVEVLESTPEYIDIKYNLVDENTGEVTEDIVERFDITLDDAGAWQIDKVGLLSSLVNSPTVWARHGDFIDEVKAAQRLDNVSAKLYNKLTKLHMEAMSPILGKGWSIKGLSPVAREKMARLDKILLQGDREKRVFTVDELRSGQLDGGIALKDDEIEAYYKTRELVNTFLQLRDFARRRDYQIRGLKSLIIEGEDVSIFGKPLTRDLDAVNSVNQTGRKMFYDSVDGVTRSFSDIDIAEMYRDGWTFTRLADPHRFKGADTEVYYVLHRTEDVHELPFDIIPKREGYIPKVNLKAAYFVKQFSSRNIDGTLVSAQDGRAASKTVRVFDNKQDAEAFAIEQEMIARREGKSPDEVFFKALGDRELEAFRASSGTDETFGLGTGGMFTGARGDEDLLFGLDGVEMPRADAFTALSTNIASLSRYVPRNEWRLGLERKAVNTANALVAFGNRRYTTFDELANAPLDHDSGIIIRNLHRQISDWNNVPSQSEILYKYTVQKFIDSAIGRKLTKTKSGSDTLHALKSVDPVTAARAAAFHGMLGWFNPVQLWVQAQGAMTSLSMSMFNPAQLGRVMQNQTALQVLQHVKFTDANVKHVAKALGMDVNELKDLKTAWDKSGLFDGVLTTADHAAASRGYGIGMDALKRSADKGLTFYRSGELFNRRLAFTTSYQEWRAANKGAELSDEALKGILDRSNNLMLNMTKAARSQYQKGLLSLPTQFMSINHRTIEALLGVNGNFTRGERGKIIMGQVAMYGAAGVPLGNYVAQEVAAMLGYDTQEKIEKEMPPELRKLINEGFVGMTTLAMFGADLDISDRSSLVGSMDDFVDELVFGDGTLFENISGAFGTQGGRFWSAATDKWAPFSIGLSADRPVDYAKVALNPLINSITTFRNIDKAIFMHNYHQLLDSKNRLVIPKDFSLVEEMATAIGIRLTDEVEVYDIEKRERYLKEYRSNVANQITMWYRQAAVDAMDGALTDEKKQVMMDAVATLMQTVPSPRDRRLISETVAKNLKESGNRRNKAWTDYMKSSVNEAVDELHNIRSLFVNTGVMQEGSYEGQEVIENGE